MLAALTFASMIAATPQSQDSQDLKSLTDVTALAAYTLGACDAHLTAEQVTAVLAVLFLADDVTPQEETSAFAGVNARQYLKGRQDPRRFDMTSEVCQRLMYQSLRDMNAASEAITG